MPSELPMPSNLIVNLQNNEFIVTLDAIAVKAVIGKGGLIQASNKREGDGKTPIGTWPLRQIYYRADRLTLPDCGLDAEIITKQMGWCDDPDHPCYNQTVSLPFSASHERLWRDDHAYDVVIPLGYNDAPPTPGAGSAIFFHILHEGRDFTEGCVAISTEDMMNLLPVLGKDSVMTILGDDQG